MNKILTSAFLLVVTAATAYGLECYQCDSSKSMFCNFGLTSFVMPSVDCSKQTESETANILTSWIPQQCVKFTAKDDKGNDYVARGCIPYNGGVCDVLFSGLGFFSELSGGAKDVNCYTCNGDKCNSSVSLKPSLAATLILSILFYFLKH